MSDQVEERVTRALYLALLTMRRRLACLVTRPRLDH